MNDNSPRKILSAIKNYQPKKWYLVCTVSEEISDAEMLRILRSDLPTQVQNKSLNLDLKYQLPEIEKVLYEQLRLFRYNAQTREIKSVCILATIDEVKLSRAKRGSVKDLLNIINIPVSKVKDSAVLLANIPDFIYVFNQEVKKSQSSKSTKKIKVTFTPENAQAFSGQTIKDDNLIFEKRSKYSNPEHNRYYEKFSMTDSKVLRHGTGSEKYLRTVHSGWLLFVRNALKEIQRKFQPESLDILFSQSFEPLKKKLSGIIESEVHSKNLDFNFLSSDTFLSSQSEEPKNLAKSPKKIKKNSRLNIQGAHNVAKALRKGEVEKLIIDVNFESKGYITPDSKCYTYPVKNSKKVDSIRPWILKSAVDTSADILITNSDKGSIFATTRY